MRDSPTLEYRVEDGILIVRPLLRVLGPWDGAEDQLPEVLTFCDSLRTLLRSQPRPLLLDLSAYEFTRNWTWLVPLVRECKDRGRSLALWVSPTVAEQFAVIKYDRLVPVRTTFAQAMVAFGPSNPAEPLSGPSDFR